MAVEHGFDGILVSNHGGRATETLRSDARWETAAREPSRHYARVCRLGRSEALNSYIPGYS
jgi:hypothetical protein